LGPDLLSGDFDAGEALARLEARPETEIGEALLDQHAVAGIGNVYKSEILYVARIDPWQRVGQLDRTSLSGIVSVARRLLVANAAGRPRRTTGETPGPRHWVYGRAGRPCQRCGTRVERRRQGALARLTYWCPRCQPAAARPRCG
jgi:endonuclease-8